MLCCYQWSDPASAYNQQTSDGAGVSSFPGQRRYVKTEGNALAGAPPVQETHPQQSHMTQTNIPTPMAPSLSQPSTQPQAEKAGGELVSVTVPQGLRPGQIIHVMHPDGSGLKISAQIPDGLVPGEIFYIKAPAPLNDNNVFLPPSGLAATSTPEHPTSSMPMASADLMGPTPDVPPVQQQQQEPPPFSQCLDSPVNFSPSSQRRQTLNSPQSNSNRPTAAPPIQQSTAVPLKSPPTALLKVLVPPGAMPGSVVHVQIPGENRKIAAQVPPNCTEFHVRYEPQQQQQTLKQSQPVSAPPGQKLLKVQVPPGMKPGEIVHVRIPNEPDRVVKAQVPPGNVREFHVAYRPALPQ